MNDKVNKYDFNKIKKSLKDIKGQNEKIIEKKSENISIQQQNTQKENQYKREADNLNKNNIIEQLENKSPIYPMLSKFKNTPKIGLANIGSTNCMNSFLQCFSHTAPLTEYFLNPEHKEIITKGKFNKDKNKPRLSKAYYRDIQNLWPLNKTSKDIFFSPNKFKNVLGTLIDYFKILNTIDIKDLIIFFLEQIHKETSLIKNSLYKNYWQNYDFYNRDLTFNHFINENSCSSIISDNFFGISEITIKCQNCFRMNTPNYIQYNYKALYYLIFPLEEVRIFRDNNINKKMTMNNQMIFLNIGVNPMISPNIDIDPMIIPNMVIDPNYNTNKVTIYDCFKFNQKDELMCGDSKFYCNICKKLTDTLYGDKIYIWPEIFIIILNRGKNNIYKVILDYPLEMDLSNYVISSINNEKYIYSLYGVIAYREDSGKKIHYIATCKSPLDGKWFRYDDINVIPISDLNKEVLNFNIPYILFYQRKK